ncbi:acetolactate synthase large subunit [Candidatus Woesearchaeota archaeon]|nr:acetolactate synthase large subunit [Candidatus Woesearchaeota archaeon]
MNASGLFVKCLENEGVQFVFGLPGEETQDLVFSMEDSGVKFVVARHEQGAAFMADVYGRVTGRAGVCLSTLGPGATNLVTGVADANLDHSPLVAVTAQGSTERLHKESHQIIDVVNLFGPITKWNTRVLLPRIIPEAVRKAFKVAEMEKPGAAHIELPEDVAAMPAEGVPLVREKVRRAAPDYKALARAVEIINGSSRPLILAGNGAIRKLASNQLRLFVERTGIPVISTFMGKGAVSDRSRESLLGLGLGTHHSVQEVLDAADVIISVGYDIAEFDPKKINPGNRKNIVHIDFSPAEVYDHYQPSVEVVADVSNTLWHLNQEVKKRFAFPEAEIYRGFLEKSVFGFESNSFPVHPKFALRKLRECIPDSAIVISDVGAHKMWVGSSFPAYERGTVIISNGLASMGIALPGAIGAKLASSDSEVVAVMGDGGFLMNVQELETAVRLGLEFVVVLFNDNSYSLIEAKFIKGAGRTLATDLTNPDFGLLARSFGCSYFRPGSAAELDSVFREAVSGKGVRIVEVPVDKSRNLEFFS